MDESHFSVGICACVHCGQQFLRVFCEQIDWVDGQDPQYFLTAPVSEDEVGNLRMLSGVDSLLAEIFMQRITLRHDFPKDAQFPVNRWAHGMVMPAHD